MTDHLTSVLGKYWFYNQFREGKISKNEFWRLLQLFKEDIEHELKGDLNFSKLIEDLSLQEVLREAELIPHPISKSWNKYSSQFTETIKDLYEWYCTKINRPNLDSDILIEIV